MLPSGVLTRSMEGKSHTMDVFCLNAAAHSAQSQLGFLAEFLALVYALPTSKTAVAASHVHASVCNILVIFGEIHNITT